MELDYNLMLNTGLRDIAIFSSMLLIAVAGHVMNG